MTHDNFQEYIKLFEENKEKNELAKRAKMSSKEKERLDASRNELLKRSEIREYYKEKHKLTQTPILAWWKIKKLALDEDGIQDEDLNGLDIKAMCQRHKDIGYEETVQALKPWLPLTLEEEEESRPGQFENMELELRIAIEGEFRDTRKLNSYTLMAWVRLKLLVLKAAHTIDNDLESITSKQVHGALKKASASGDNSGVCEIFDEWLFLQGDYEEEGEDDEY